MSDNRTTFDKFINDILRREKEKRESQQKYADEHADTPQRKYNELYRERWQNRIKWAPRRK